MSPFLFNLNFWNNKKIYQKPKKNLKKYFQKHNLKKKVVPAITDIYTGGQQCKYQLLGSIVNISYYLHGGDFFVIVLKKYEGMQISLSNFAHTHTHTHTYILEL